MNYSSKICPHCKIPLQPSEGVFELIKKGKVISDPNPGLPVVLYSCPQCGYIELYNFAVTSRI